MPLALLLLPLALQVGPGPALPQAPLEIPRGKPATAAPRRAPIRLPGRLEHCLDQVRGDAPAAERAALAWRGESADDRAAPGHYLGVALAAQGRFAEAESAFLAGRAAALPGNPAQAARLGGMAANAALAQGAASRALAVLDGAHGEALAARDTPLAADLSIDRARALVALDRADEAAAALAEARAGNPGEPQAWLLSATLARRRGRLAEAQGEIEQAARLSPLDPEIGLEAGVIAALAGRDAAARASFDSVVRTAPGSETARRAQAYLAQLGPEPVPPGR